MDKPRFFKIALCAVGLVTTILPAARGNEVMRQVQEELRKRKVYFGDIDGRETRELRAALTHFQKSRGLRDTGDLSEETLDTLDIAVPVGEFGFPEGVVLRSDPGPGPETVLIDIAATPPREIVEPPEAKPVPPEKAVTEESLTAFIRQYLADSAGPAQEAEISHYAPVVHYFDHGIRPRSFVQNDVEEYRKRWPQRDYSLAGPVKVETLPSGESEVTFMMNFDLDRPRQRAKGRTREVFTIDTDRSQWLIVGMKEERIRN